MSDFLIRLCQIFDPFTPKSKKYVLMTFQEKCISYLVVIGTIITI